MDQREDTRNKRISDVPIMLEIFSKDAVTLSLVDLPGIARDVPSDQENIEVSSASGRQGRLQKKISVGEVWALGLGVHILVQNILVLDFSLKNFLTILMLILPKFNFLAFFSRIFDDLIVRKFNLDEN